MELSGSNVLRYEMADGTSLIVRKELVSSRYIQ